MKTVLIYKDELLPPSETFIQAQASALLRYRAQYVGVSRSADSLPVSDDAIFAVPVKASAIGRFRKALYYRTGFAPGFHRALRAAEPSVLHAHFAHCGMNALRIAERLRIPLVVTLHGHDVTIKRDYRGMYQELWNNAALFICVSEFIREKALEAGFPATKLRVLYIGIKVTLTKDAERIDDLVLFTGRLVEKKGCSYLLRAMPTVMAACPNTHLIIIGDGPMRSELSAQAVRLEFRCTFLGTQPPDVVRSYQQRAAVVCVPSVTAANGDSEGLPTVILEGIMAGSAVVATTHAGIPELIDNRKTGLLVPERDIEVLADAIVEALRDSALRRRCVRSGQDLIREKFDLSKQTQKLEDIYDETVRIKEGTQLGHVSHASSIALSGGRNWAT